MTQVTFLILTLSITPSRSLASLVILERIRTTRSRLPEIGATIVSIAQGLHLWARLLAVKCTRSMPTWKHRTLFTKAKLRRSPLRHLQQRTRKRGEKHLDRHLMSRNSSLSSRWRLLKTTGKEKVPPSFLPLHLPSLPILS